MSLIPQCFVILCCSIIYQPNKTPKLKLYRPALLKGFVNTFLRYCNNKTYISKGVKMEAVTSQTFRYPLKELVTIFLEVIQPFTHLAHWIWPLTRCHLLKVSLSVSTTGICNIFQKGVRRKGRRLETSFVISFLIHFLEGQNSSKTSEVVLKHRNDAWWCCVYFTKMLRKKGKNKL